MGNMLWIKFYAGKFSQIFVVLNPHKIFCK